MDKDILPFAESLNLHSFGTNISLGFTLPGDKDIISIFQTSHV